MKKMHTTGNNIQILIVSISWRESPCTCSGARPDTINTRQKWTYAIGRVSRVERPVNQVTIKPTYQLANHPTNRPADRQR